MAIENIAVVFTEFKVQTEVAAVMFAAGGYYVLVFSMAIVIVKAWMESVLTDQVSLVETFVSVVIYGGIILMALENQSVIHKYVWELADEVAAQMGGAAGMSGVDGASGVLTSIWDSTVQLFRAMWAMFLTTSTPEDACDAWEVGCNLQRGFEVVSSGLVSAILFIIVIVMVGIYAVIIILQVFTGFFMVGIGLMLLPLALSFYPIIESWTKNAIGLIMSGIVHVGMVAFLMTLVSKTMETLLKAYAEGQLTFFEGSTTSPGWMSSMGDAVAGKVVAMFVMIIFMLVLGLASAKAIGFATQIFGSVGGMMGGLAPGRPKSSSNKDGSGGSSQSSGGGGGEGAGGGGGVGLSGAAGNMVRTGVKAGIAASTGGAGAVAVDAAQTGADAAGVGAEGAAKARASADGAPSGKAGSEAGAATSPPADGAPSGKAGSEAGAATSSTEGGAQSGKAGSPAGASTDASTAASAGGKDGGKDGGNDGGKDAGQVGGGRFATAAAAVGSAAATAARGVGAAATKAAAAAGPLAGMAKSTGFKAMRSYARSTFGK